MKESDFRELAERVAHLEKEVARLSAQLEVDLSFSEEQAEAREDLGIGEIVAPPLSEPVRPPPLPPREIRPQEEPVRTPVVGMPTPRVEERKRVPERDWRGALRQWHLWPPESDGNVEVQLGAWWATRLGALIAVIGVVFFGIYVAQGTPPWVRLAQLIAVAAGVTGAGHWLERRIPRFGAVVFGSGLALLFFGGFAAYAVPAVKVIDSAGLAVLVQAISVCGIVACSLWKDRAVLGTMAISLGFVTCLFSFFSNLPDISLVASLILAAAGVALWLRRGWLAAFGISVPGAYLVFAVIAAVSWNVAGAPVLAVALAHPVAAFLLFLAADFGGLALGRTRSAWERRLLQGTNLGGAVGLSVWVAVEHFPEELGAVYFFFALLIGVAAFLYYRRDREDEWGHVAFATAMGLLGLGWIEVLGARTRWVALAVQSAVALVAARRTKVKTAEVSVFVLWGAAFLLFFWDTAAAGIFVSRGAGWSLWGAAAAVFVGTSLLIFSWHGRWMGRKREVTVASGMALGVAATAAVYAGATAEFFSSASIGTALVLAGAGILLRHWVGALAAVVPFVAGQLAFVGMPGNPEAASLWVNGAVAVGAGIAVAACVQWAAAKGRIAGSETDLRRVIGVAHVVWMVAVQALVFKTATLETSVVLAAGLSLSVLVLARRTRIDYLGDLGMVPLALVFGAMIWGMERPELPVSGNGWWLGLGVAGSFGAVCVRERWLGSGGNRRLFSGRGDVVVGGIVATVLGAYLLGREFEGAEFLVWTGLLGIAVTLLARWPGWGGGVYAGLTYLLFGHAVSAAEVLIGMKDGGVWGGLGADAVLAGCAVAFAVLVGRPAWGVREKAAAGLQWIVGAVGLGVLFLGLASPSGDFSAYATAMWGIAAIGFFVAGLIWRVKPLRIVGVAGLGICLPRIFMVDLHSAFHRIAAFVVVGLVLLLVGFLYHKFRHRIGSVGTSGKGEGGVGERGLGE